MKKTVVLIMALILAFTLAACSSGPDISPAIDAYNEASTAFQAATELINANLDRFGDESYQVFVTMNESLTMYGEQLRDENTKFTEEELSEMINWLKEAKTWAETVIDDIESQLEG